MKTLPPDVFTVRTVLRRALTINAPLTIASIVFAFALVGTLVGLAIDHRVLAGVPAWEKPTKFMLSDAIYSFTFVWLLGFVRGHRQSVRVIAWVTSIALILEDVLIALQALRGTTSHFNFSTPFDGAIWSSMAALIVCFWAANLLLGIVLLRQRFADAAFAWALRLGVFISFIGIGLAFTMTTPTRATRGAREQRPADHRRAHGRGGRWRAGAAARRLEHGRG